MSSPFLGEIRAFGFGFPPKGWALCNGQLLSIQQNTALFALLGTFYGGNGVNNFGLPNLQGRVPLGMSGSIPIGQIAGVENVTLLTSELPAHNHALLGVNANGANHLPATGAFANSATSDAYYATDASPQPINQNTVTPVGGNQPHSNIQPYLCISWCIALLGVFPSRN